MNDDTLSSTLTAVANDLRMLKADLSFRQITTAVKSVLTYQNVQDRIAECSSKLDWAMSVFQASDLTGYDTYLTLTLGNSDRVIGSV